MLALVVAPLLLLSTHVQSSDPIISPVLTDGVRGSSVLGRLVEVVDRSGVNAAYARHGLVLAGERVDSNAARQAGEQRRAELMRRSR